jgi:hydrogenase expression/formation protein HypC
MGDIEFGGITKQASLAYVPEVVVGDFVIVHAGFAISRLDEKEADEVFGYLREMQELADLEERGGGQTPAGPCQAQAPGIPPSGIKQETASR